jgi:cytochrome c oxidase subunit 1
MAFTAGIHFWFPKMSGRMYNEKSALWAFVLILVGFNLTFFPQFIVGAQGMPRRYWSYLPEFTRLNQLSTVGSWFLFAGFAWVAVYLYKAMKSGAKAPANPWESLTLEWQSPSPPPHDNFLESPVVTSWPYEYRTTSSAGRA